MKPNDLMHIEQLLIYWRSHPAKAQFAIYFIIGCISALSNIAFFSIIYWQSKAVFYSALAAYGLAAVVNYTLCKCWAFKTPTAHSQSTELFLYVLVVLFMAFFDAYITEQLALWLTYAIVAKVIACFVCFLMNFTLRKYIVFRVA